MKSFLQFTKYFFFFVSVSQSIYSQEIIELKDVNFPPVIEAHHPVNNLSAFKCWQKLLSQEYAKKIAYVGAYKIHEHMNNSDDIVKMLAAFRTHKSSECQYKIFSESRLSDVEKYSNSELQFVGKNNLIETLDSFLIHDISVFNNIHMKILLTDCCFSVGTTNFDEQPYKNDDKNPHQRLLYQTRDFTTFITDPLLIEHGENVLESILLGKVPNIPNYQIGDIKNNETRLSWGPWHHLDHILQLINQATSSIYIYQQDLQSSDICKALKEKLAKNTEIKILMSGYPFGKRNGNRNLNNLRQLKNAGAKMCLVGKKPRGEFFDKPLHIHAKVLITDSGDSPKAMYLGSANFYPDVLDPSKKNLNLGIITKDMKFIDPVIKFFNADWKDHENFGKASLEYWEGKFSRQIISKS